MGTPKISGKDNTASQSAMELLSGRAVVRPCLERELNKRK